MSFSGLLDSLCDVKGEIPGEKDGAGGYLPSTWTIIYRRVPCCWETISMQKKIEILAYDKMAVIPDFYVYMEFLSGINERCRLIRNGKEFDIKLVEDTKLMGVYMKVAVAELKRGEDG